MLKFNFLGLGLVLDRRQHHLYRVQLLRKSHPKRIRMVKAEPSSRKSVPSYSTSASAVANLDRIRFRRPCFVAMSPCRAL